MADNTPNFGTRDFQELQDMLKRDAEESQQRLQQANRRLEERRGVEAQALKAYRAAIASVQEKEAEIAALVKPRLYTVGWYDPEKDAFFVSGSVHTGAEAQAMAGNGNTSKAFGRTGKTYYYVGLSEAQSFLDKEGGKRSG